MAAGLGADWLLQPKVDDANGKPDAPIEWHAVQAVPRRLQTPDEVAWEKRGEDQPSVIASPEGVRQSTRQPVTVTYGSASEEAGLPRGSAARNDGARGGRVTVIDGDTFVYRGQRVRILGIDAPETHPSRCAREAELGAAATLKLRELLGSGTVTMTPAGQDRYGRVLAEVRVDGYRSITIREAHP